MGRHKTIDSSDENRRELYEKYIEPNHLLVRNTVAMLTHKKTDIDDNLQDMCHILLRNIDTYNPEMKLSNWIITVCRREVGKIEARKPSYVDARKGSEFEYVTEHHGYKAKYRPKKTKDFVNVYDDSVFTSEPDEMIHNGVDDDLFELLNKISPELDFGCGSFSDIEDAIINGEDKDLMIYFRNYFYREKKIFIAEMLDVEVRNIVNAVNRVKKRIKRILEDE